MSLSDHSLNRKLGIAISFPTFCSPYSICRMVEFFLERCISGISLQVVPTVYKDVRGKAIKSNQVELNSNVSSFLGWLFVGHGV